MKVVNSPRWSTGRADLRQGSSTEQSDVPQSGRPGAGFGHGCCVPWRRARTGARTRLDLLANQSNMVVEPIEVGPLELFSELAQLVLENLLELDLQLSLNTLLGGQDMACWGKGSDTLTDSFATRNPSSESLTTALLGPFATP